MAETPLMRSDSETFRADASLDRLAPAPWEDYERRSREEWLALLDEDPPEREVQAFLERHPSLLPGGTDNIGPGGHHGVCWSAVVRQPELPGLDARVPDFMWVRRDTAAVRPILIEIEAPAKPWFIGTREPNAKLIHALDQLLEWKVWFADPANQQTFRRAYVPPEYTHRALEPRYVLVYGRDREFRPGTSPHSRPDQVRRKRDLLPHPDEHLFTFDLLHPERDASNYATISGFQQAFRLAALPPTFTTGESTRQLAGRLSDISEALKSTGIGDERSAYLVDRWAHWRRQAMEHGEFVSDGSYGE